MYVYDISECNITVELSHLLRCWQVECEQCHPVVDPGEGPRGISSFQKVLNFKWWEILVLVLHNVLSSFEEN